MKSIMIKVVIVGDGGVGKSRLLMTYADNIHPTDHVHPPFYNFVVSRLINQYTISLRLFDTPGQPNHEYDRLRVLTYGLYTDFFLMCFSLVDPKSYESIRTKWYPEISHHIPSAKILLVGTQLDLRDDPEVVENLVNHHMAPITYQQGLSMCKDISALGYFECSGLSGQGTDAIFEEAMRIVESSIGKPVQFSEGLVECLRWVAA